jgi:hypothetical protein
MGKTRQIKMFDDLADGGGQVFYMETLTGNVCEG